MEKPLEKGALVDLPYQGKKSKIQSNHLDLFLKSYEANLSPLSSLELNIERRCTNSVNLEADFASIKEVFLPSVSHPYTENFGMDKDKWHV